MILIEQNIYICAKTATIIKSPTKESIMQSNKKDEPTQTPQEAKEQTKTETDTVGAEVGVPGLVRFFATHTSTIETKTQSPRKLP